MTKKSTKSPDHAKGGKPPTRSPNPKTAESDKPAPKGKARAIAAAPAENEAAAHRLTPDQLRKQLVAKARSRTKSQRAAAFTLDDVRGELARAKPARKEGSRVAPKAEAAPKTAAASASTTTSSARAGAEHRPAQQRRLGAASLADILGYNPTADEKPEDEEAQVDKKFLRYYKLLVQLRDHVKSGLAMHAEDTLKRSSRDDSGDLSGYGQHMADAGTDAFDRDFALSLVSNEQEALYEIEEAIKRIKNGTYGVCELTGKPISKERLLAVPFARYSVESQAEVEKNRRRSAQRSGVFADATGEEGSKFIEEESE